MGLFETIRAAVAGQDGISALADLPGADAPNPSNLQETEAMTTANPAPGAGANAGISEADHKAAVTTAEAAGRKEANDRMAAILGAEGIKGDGGRMSAALDLATQSPDMAADAVVKFVSANVPAAKGSGASAYEEQRLLAGGLTQTGEGDKPNNDNKVALGASLARANKRR